ncbi:MAG: hypothetical protein AAGA95_19530 [Pseudomonadota bacterium]
MRIAALLLFFLSGHVPAQTIDQRDEAYQLAMEHVARSAQSIQAALTELSQARQSHELPGVRWEEQTAKLEEVKAIMEMLIYPEAQRLRHHVLTPDAHFFVPVNPNQRVDDQ